MTVRYRISVNEHDEFEVEADAPASLLESLEQHGIETHFHCRSGFCGACRTKLLAGEVSYHADPLAYVRTGEILPCICKAVSDLKLEH